MVSIDREESDVSLEEGVPRRSTASIRALATVQSAAALSVETNPESGYIQLPCAIPAFALLAVLLARVGV